MSDSLIILVTSICSMIIGIVTVWGLLLNFSDKFVRKFICKGLDSIRLSDLDPKSDMSKILTRSESLSENYCGLIPEINREFKQLGQLSESIGNITKELDILKRDRFKTELRSRLEYVISSKGKVNKSYWEHIAEDYNYYTDVLHMNTYMKSLYQEAEKFYMKTNFYGKQ